MIEVETDGTIHYCFISAGQYNEKDIWKIVEGSPTDNRRAGRSRFLEMTNVPATRRTASYWQQMRLQEIQTAC